MNAVVSAIAWLAERPDLLATIGLAVIAFIRATAWGRAQSAALDATVSAIELARATEAKTFVRARQRALSRAAADALDDAVARVDTKKPKPRRRDILRREILRNPFEA
jgi:hypothetical protein